jgi:hypothetical protein
MSEQAQALEQRFRCLNRANRLPTSSRGTGSFGRTSRGTYIILSYTLIHKLIACVDVLRAPGGHREDRMKRGLVRMVYEVERDG